MQRLTDQRRSRRRALEKGRAPVVGEAEQTRPTEGGRGHGERRFRKGGTCRATLGPASVCNAGIARRTDPSRWRGLPVFARACGPLLKAHIEKHLRCCEPRGALSYGSPRGKLIAKPAEQRHARPAFSLRSP